jgi:hypothetical protein
MTALLNSNAACFSCLQQFLYDGAVAKCLAPFLSSDCNHELTCATDCSGSACGNCAKTDQQGCQAGTFKAQGECSSYVYGLFCAAAAYQGPGAFCDPKNAGDIGVWLQGVGTYYCSG